MSIQSFEIRVCESCGLRYPLISGSTFGERCPHCLGMTRVAFEKEISAEANLLRRNEAQPKLTVLVDNVRSAWNVGSILRTADGFGFKHAYLCGITPTPEQDAVQKTSLGAEEFVTWSYHKDAVKLVRGLKKEGFGIWGLEEGNRSIEINQDFKMSVHTILIVGNEVAGVDPQLLELCDQLIYISMYGQKRSFNVSVAFGIAAQRLSEIKS